MSMVSKYKKYLFESPSVAKGIEPELKVENFVWERKLDEGAFGQVWRVRHKNSDKVCALKKVPKEKVMKMLPQFTREVRIMYDLDHKHIIKLFNHFEDEKFFYLIMEYAEGGNLFHKLYRERQFVERVAAQYFREVLLAIEYLHSFEIPIIHRDLKPENILLDKNGYVKVTDFGWSNYYNKDTAIPRTTVCGTLEYLPPEMVNEQGHHPSADIWCLGVLLFEMLVGYTPFKSQDRDRMLENISQARPKFPLSFPRKAKELVCKILKKNPLERPSSDVVKNDPWLLDQVPIRETLIQEIVGRKTFTFDDSAAASTPQTGYVVMSEEKPAQAPEPPADNKPSMTDTMTYSDDESEMGGGDTARTISSIDSFLDGSLLRQSIDMYKNKIKTQKMTKNDAADNLEKLKTQLTTNTAKISELEASLNKKKEQLTSMNLKERNLLRNISELNFEHEKLSKSVQASGVAEKTTKLKKQALEMTREIKIKSKVLENLKHELRQKEKHINEKEGEIKNIQHALLKLQKESRLEKQDLKRQINDLSVQKEILQARVNSLHQESTMTAEEDKLAEDILKYLKNNTSRLNSSFQDEEIKKKIAGLEEDIKNKESQIVELQQNYEEEREQLIIESKNKRDQLIREDRELRERRMQQIQDHQEKEMGVLRESITSARQSIGAISKSEIEKAKEKLAKAQDEKNYYKKQIDKRVDCREDNLITIDKLQEDLNGLEMRLAEAKAKSFMEDA